MVYGNIRFVLYSFPRYFKKVAGKELWSVQNQKISGRLSPLCLLSNVSPPVLSDGCAIPLPVQIDLFRTYEIGCRSFLRWKVQPTDKDSWTAL